MINIYLWVTLIWFFLLRKKKGEHGILYIKIECVINGWDWTYWIVGDYITWSNTQQENSSIRERLDCVVSSIDWLECYPNSKVFFISLVTSDNIPLLTLFDASVSYFTNPFNFWIQYNYFLSFVITTFYLLFKELGNKLFVVLPCLNFLIS